MAMLVLLVRGFFGAALAITVGLNSVPSARSDLYAYGKAASTTHSTTRATMGRTGTGAGAGDGLRRLVYSDVPHRWFTHFYAYSLLTQLFWLAQILFHGRALQTVTLLAATATATATATSRPSQSRESILLAVGCMVFQSARRLYESRWVQKQSAVSRMGILIYVAGVLHYTVMGIATWCEGADSLGPQHSHHDQHRLQLQLHLTPRINTVVFLPVFALSSAAQTAAHTHLASLVKYSVPTHWLFAYTLSPHYLAECVIYFALMFVGAPVGCWINRSLCYVWIFVCVNQALSASLNQQWYRRKFGPTIVAGRWALLPLVW